MKSVVLHSIPGSGTRFTRDWLTEVFWYKVADYVSYNGESGVVMLNHVEVMPNPLNVRYDMTPEDIPHVIPIRHPADNLKTLRRNGVPLSQCALLWGLLYEYVKDKDVYFFPMGADINQLYLVEGLRAFLGVSSFDIDKYLHRLNEWPKTGSSASPLDKDEPIGPLEEYVGWYDEIVAKF